MEAAMTKLTPYFSHDCNARNDERMVKLQVKHGLAGVGLYWCIIEMLSEATGYMLKTDYEDIAYSLHCDAELVRGVVEDFKLFVIKGKKFYSQSLLNRMEKRDALRKKGRDNAMKRWHPKVETVSPEGKPDPEIISAAGEIANLHPSPGLPMEAVKAVKEAIEYEVSQGKTKDEAIILIEQGTIDYANSNREFTYGAKRFYAERGYHSVQKKSQMKEY
jgi:hypothetical protein